MPKYLRVKQAGTGHHLSLPASHIEAAPKGAYSELKSDATDAAGAPLPPKYHTSVSSEAEQKKPGHQAASSKEND